MSFEESKIGKSPKAKIEKEEEFNPVNPEELKEFHEYARGFSTIRLGSRNPEIFKKIEKLSPEERARLDDIEKRRNKELQELEGPTMDPLDPLKRLLVSPEKAKQHEEELRRFREEFAGLPVEEQNRRLLREAELKIPGFMEKWAKMGSERQKEWLDNRRFEKQRST